MTSHENGVGHGLAVERVATYGGASLHQHGCPACSAVKTWNCGGYEAKDKGCPAEDSSGCSAISDM